MKLLLGWIKPSQNRAPFIDVSGGSEARPSSRSIKVGEGKIEELKARPSSRLIDVGEAKMCTNVPRRIIYQISFDKLAFQCLFGFSNRLDFSTDNLESP